MAGDVVDPGKISTFTLKPCVGIAGSKISGSSLHPLDLLLALCLGLQAAVSGADVPLPAAAAK